jgi:zinc transport system substrate-binding protein
LTSPKLSQTIAQEVGARALALNPIEGLSDREMTEGRDYFTVMRENLDRLQTALECRK